jgi:hypothetical protein
VRTLVILFQTCILIGNPLSSVTAQWTTHFEDICELSQWLDVQVTEGWNIQSLETHDISVTNPGYFTMMPHTVTWYADWRGPLIYRLTEGDFVFTGNITVTNRNATGIPGSAYSLGGLMVRNRKALTNGPAGWVPGEEDYVFLSIGQGAENHPSCPGCPSPHFEVKSTINSASTLNLSSIDTNVVDVRMIRLHPFVLVLYRFPGEAWVVHRRYFRDDLQDTVQVGMVTYTDWDKASTYANTFHNSHVLNEELDPDPSNNPGQPFAPDIITRYDYLDLQMTAMPAGWQGLDLTNSNIVSDAAILDYYGESIATPAPADGEVWLGRENESWVESGNWLNGETPGSSDTVRVNSCVCPEASCVVLGSGLTAISGLRIAEGGEVTVPVGATLNVNGLLENEGTIIVYGVVNIMTGEAGVVNRGVIDCRVGGSVVIEE